MSFIEIRNLTIDSSVDGIKFTAVNNLICHYDSPLYIFIIKNIFRRYNTLPIYIISTKSSTSQRILHFITKKPLFFSRTSTLYVFSKSFMTVFAPWSL